MTGPNGLILCYLCYLLFKYISVFRLKGHPPRGASDPKGSQSLDGIDIEDDGTEALFRAVDAAVKRSAGGIEANYFSGF